MQVEFRKFFRSSDGAITPFGLFLLIAIFAVGGLAIDVTNAVRERTYLQVAADAAAHAALVTRDSQSASAARTEALKIADGIMPNARFGNTIQSGDIIFGTYDPVTKGFKVDETSTSAVLVNTQRVASRNNAVGTYFLRLIGFDQWNVVRQSVFVTYKPACLREGYVAQGEVNVQSGNHFYAGFCIHSNSGVTVSSNNEFDSGTITSMPSIANDLSLPASGFTTNGGLQDSLRTASYKLPILQRISDIEAGIGDPTSPYYRSYLTSAVEVNVSTTTAVDKSWQTGRIMRATCKSQMQQLLISQDAVLKDGVLITNCQIQAASGVAMEDAAIISENTQNPSFTTAGTFRMGIDDGCKEGGGAQIITLGGVQFAAGAEFYGAQVIAGKDIVFQSNAAGLDGVSLVAGGMIDGTSNANIGFCDGGGMENNFEAWYFRMGA